MKNKLSHVGLWVGMWGLSLGWAWQKCNHLQIMIICSTVLITYMTESKHRLYELYQWTVQYELAGPLNSNYIVIFNLALAPRQAVVVYDSQTFWLSKYLALTMLHLEIINVVLALIWSTYMINWEGENIDCCFKLLGVCCFVTVRVNFGNIKCKMRGNVLILVFSWGS